MIILHGPTIGSVHHHGFISIRILARFNNIALRFLGSEESRTPKIITNIIIMKTKDNGNREEEKVVVVDK